MRYCGRPEAWEGPRGPLSPTPHNWTQVGPIYAPTRVPFTCRFPGVNEVGWAFAPAFVDVDNDGWLDLYATTGFLSFDRGKPDG